MDVKSSIILPCVMASLFVGVLLAMNAKMPQYATSIREFSPVEEAFFRLEGTIQHLNDQTETTDDTRLAMLCDENICLHAKMPVMYLPRLKPQSRIIVEGIWKHEMLHVSKVLTRCH
jgi:hypothetical protein